MNVTREQLHNDATLRKLVADRVTLANQIEGREKQLARFDKILAGTLTPDARLHFEKHATRQRTLLAAGRVRLAQLDHTIATMAGEG